MVFVHDSKQCHLQIGNFTISGFLDDTGITFEPDGDMSAMQVGADNFTTFNSMPYNWMLSFTLSSGSPSVNQLYSLFLASTDLTVLNFTFTSFSDKKKYSGVCAMKKRPGKNGSVQDAGRQYEFNCTDVVELPFS